MIIWNCPAPTSDPPAAPWISLTEDWHGRPVAPPPRFLFWLDAHNFHFACARDAPPRPHPDSESGKFQAELWRHEVGEFFLVAPDGTYLEANLAPNGAWWLAYFEKKRVPAERNFPLENVVTQARCGKSSWEARISIPRASLAAFLPDLPDLRLDAAFILQNPQQTFLTAAPLRAGEPDFHLPEQFPRTELREIPT